MDRKEFMKELEFLLQDVPYSEAKEALEYYHNYFDEAGSENESKVIAELGSPEKIAATIKAGLNDNFAEDIEYGETGASNDQYRENYDVIEAKAKEKKKEPKKSRFQGNQNRNQILLIGIIIAALCLCLPVASGVFGIFGVLFVLALIAGLGWIALLILALLAFINACEIIGIFTGAGLVTLGGSFICLAFALAFFGLSRRFFQLIPIVFRTIIDGIRKILGKAGK